jgi:NitT/TauT family transport system substrate-binding protein
MLRLWAATFATLGLLVPTAHAQEQTVTVQLVRSIAQAPYYIAVGKGYFAKEGIKVSSGNVRSALDTIGPLATGRLDVSIGAATAGFFNAAHEGFDLRLMAPMGIQGPVMATQPVIRKALWDNGTIRSGKDYLGHKIAINAPGDITEYFLTLMAKKYNIPFKNLNVLPLGFAQQMVAFKTGAIDAGFLPEPLSTSARLSGSVVLNTADAGIGEGTVTTFLFFGTKFMHERPKVALAFLRALLLGARDAQGDYLKDPTIAASVAKQTGIKLAAIEKSTPYRIDPSLDMTKYEPNLRQQEAIHRERGELHYKGSLDFSKIVDTGLIRRAAASMK